MSINLNQAFVGQGVRAPRTAEPTSAARGKPRDATPSATSADLAPTGLTQAAGAPPGVAAPPPVQSQPLIRAVEEANALAEAALSGTNRSVAFGHDEGSGRMIITIKERRDGDAVERQIPPKEFLVMMERLRALRGDEGLRGALVDLAV